MTSKTQEIARLIGGRTISTVSNYNGDDMDVKEAIIGFDSLEQAKSIAEEYGMVTRTFYKVNSRYWERDDEDVEEGIDAITESSFLGVYFNKKSDLYDRDWIEDLKEDLYSCDTIDELETMFFEKKEIFDAMRSMGDNEVAVVEGGCLSHVMPAKTMFYSDSECTIAIGIMDKY